MMSKKTKITIYITREQAACLRALRRITKVPSAEVIRQGISMILMANGADPVLSEMENKDA
jgi:hypothetical protein